METIVIGVAVLIILGGFLIAGYFLYRRNMKQIRREQKKEWQTKNEADAEEKEKFQKFLLGNGLKK